MYVTRVPNRDSPPAVLLRESYREGGKVKSRTLANISDWPEAKIDSLRRVLAGETLVPLGAEPFEIARALAHGHVAGVLGLYDVTSSYLEGRRCELAQFGYSRDHRRDRPQIVFGLLCTLEGCPVAVEVFEGNLGDPSTLANQVRKLRLRFRLKRIVLVGDRGMITQARIDAD